MQFLRGELARLTEHNRRLQGEVDELRAAAVRKDRSAVNDRDDELAQRSMDALLKYESVGATVGELRTALSRVPGEMVVLLIPHDGHEDGHDRWDERITNCGVDTTDDGQEFFSIQGSWNTDVVRAEDARRRGQ